MPVGDERGFFHEGGEHGGVICGGGGDQIDLAADGLGRILIQAGAMAGDDEGGLGGIDHGGDFAGAAQDETRHRRVDAHRQAIVQGFAAHDRGWTGELEFARDDLLSEIAFADKIRHDINFVGVDHVEGFAHGGFLFPKTAMHLREKVTAADFSGVLEVGRRRIRVFGGPVANDEKGAVWLWRNGHVEKMEIFHRIARQGRDFSFQALVFWLRMAADGNIGNIAVVDRSGGA